MNNKVNSILENGNWYPQNKLCLEALIKEKGFSDNYAVFDWDYTCIFYDTQDNLFIYQLENLCFNLTPENFSKTIRAGIPQNIPLKHCVNLHGKQLKACELSEDLDRDYEFLYKNYKGLAGNKPLIEVTSTEEYIDFKAKMIFLMRGAAPACGVDIAQSVSTGMTIKELEALTVKAIDKGLSDKIKEYTVFSSEKLTGKSGRIQTVYRKGIRTQAEIKNLIKVLNEHGIEPYICSASQEDNVRVFASNPKYGYNVKSENVFGRRRLLDNFKKLTCENDGSIPATRKEGKAEAIKKVIRSKHGNKPPVLIAGDGDGDFFMMSEFKNDAVILLFNRKPKPETMIYPFLIKGLEQRKNKTISLEGTVLVQNRNDATGEFSPE